MRDLNRRHCESARSAIAQPLSQAPFFMNAHLQSEMFIRRTTCWKKPSRGAANTTSTSPPFRTINLLQNVSSSTRPPLNRNRSSGSFSHLPLQTSSQETISERTKAALLLPTIFDPRTCRKRDFCPIPTEAGESPQQLYYELHGSTRSDATKLVFVTGLNASSFAWLKQVEYFTTNPNYSILVFDNRGSGNSTSPKGLYKTSQMAQDAVVLLDHLGWRDERSLIVVGASMGGMISMDLGLLIPNRIKALALASTKSGYRFNYPTIKTMLILCRYLLGTVWTARQSLRLSMTHMFPKEFLRKPDDTNPERRRRDILEKELVHRIGLTKKAPLKGQLGQVAAVLRHRMTKEGFTELASKIPKIAIITGDADEIVRLSDCNLLHQMLPGSEYTICAGVGHSIMLQVPAEFNAWLNQVIRTARGKPIKLEQEAKPVF